MEPETWPDQLRPGRYAKAFADTNVHAETLSRPTTDDLKVIGVMPAGHRRRLPDAIADRISTSRLATVAGSLAVGIEGIQGTGVTMDMLVARGQVPEV